MIWLFPLFDLPPSQILKMRDHLPIGHPLAITALSGVTTEMRQKMLDPNKDDLAISVIRSSPVPNP